MAKQKKTTEDLIYVVMMEVGVLLAHFGWDIEYRIFNLDQPSRNPVKEATKAVPRIVKAVSDLILSFIT